MITHEENQNGKCCLLSQSKTPNTGRSKVHEIQVRGNKKMPHSFYQAKLRAARGMLIIVAPNISLKDLYPREHTLNP